MDKKAVLAREDARNCLIESGVPDVSAIGHVKGRAYARGGPLPRAAAACLTRASERYQTPVVYAGRELADLRQAHAAFKKL